MPLAFIPQLSGQDVPFYSGASITVRLDGVPFAVASVSPKQSIDRKEVRLTGQEIGGRTRGMISRSGSMEMLKEWADLFIETLNSKFGGWSNSSFTITVTVAEESNVRWKKVSTIVMSGCRIKDFEDTYNVETSDPIKVKFDLDVDQIVVNGITATGALIAIFQA
jgi:hypothetical protein